MNHFNFGFDPYTLKILVWSLLQTVCQNMSCKVQPFGPMSGLLERLKPK